MKKIITVFLLLFSVNSHALLIIDSFTSSNKLALSNVGCLLLLPICILDEGYSDGVIDREFLIENSYSASEADIIISNQTKLMEKMTISGFRLIVGNGETSENIRNDILKALPTVDDIYLDFVIDSLGL